MKKLNLNININSLDEFYRECDNIEGGNPAEIDNIENHDDPGFKRKEYLHMVQVLVSSLNFIFLYVRIAGVQLKIL